LCRPRTGVVTKNYLKELRSVYLPHDNPEHLIFSYLYGPMDAELNLFFCTFLRTSIITTFAECQESYEYPGI